MNEKVLKGKFEKGYVALTNRLKASFIAGPLLWVFADFKTHIGVTNEVKLILLESNAGSSVVFMFPFFWSGSVGLVNMKINEVKY